MKVSDYDKYMVDLEQLAFVNFSSYQRNLIKTFQIEGRIALITKMVLIFFTRLVKWPKIDVKKCQNLIFKVDFQL